MMLICGTLVAGRQTNQDIVDLRSLRLHCTTIDAGAREAFEREGNREGGERAEEIAAG